MPKSRSIGSFDALTAVVPASSLMVRLSVVFGIASHVSEGNGRHSSIVVAVRVVSSAGSLETYPVIQSCGMSIRWTDRPASTRTAQDAVDVVVAAPSPAALDCLWSALGGSDDLLSRDAVIAQLRTWATSDDLGEAVLFSEFLAGLSAAA